MNMHSMQQATFIARGPFPSVGYHYIECKLTQQGRVKNWCGSEGEVVVVRFTERRKRTPQLSWFGKTCQLVIFNGWNITQWFQNWVTTRQGSMLHSNERFGMLDPQWEAAYDDFIAELRTRAELVADYRGTDLGMRSAFPPPNLTIVGEARGIHLQ